MISSWVAAFMNAAILLFEPTSLSVIVLRFLTGACMAGIYPVGMKMSATWSRGDTGLLVGLLVGALTLGSASPHLFNAVGGVNWRFTLIAASLSAAIAGILIRFFVLGPNHIKAPPFNPSAVFQAWTDKPIRLANLGYFGHMWELYAMWGWVGIFFHASFSFRLTEGIFSAGFYASLATFAVIAAGSVGCLFGGLFADRLGRTTLTMGSMALSGVCALGAGFLFGGDPWVLTALCLVWGFAVVADSAQFSSCVIELSNPSYVGTMLTVQTSVGFLLTLLTIHLIPPLVEAFGWRYAFAPLAIGPFLGIISMGRLRAMPDALKLSGMARRIPFRRGPVGADSSLFGVGICCGG